VRMSGFPVKVCPLFLAELKIDFSWTSTLTSSPKEAAGLLKMDHKTFLYHMKKLGIAGKKTIRN